MEREDRERGAVLGARHDASAEVVTVIRVDNGQPFIAVAELVNNADGSVSFKLPDGTYAGQSPEGGYGARHDDHSPKQYQRATLTGSCVTFYPLQGYPPYVYLIGTGKIYPA